MTKRTPTSASTEAEAQTSQLEPTDAPQQPVPGWEPAGPDGKHRHDGGRAELHPLGERPHRHDPGGLIIFTEDATAQLDSPPASAPAGGWFGNRASSSDADQQADPPPALGTASADLTGPRDGGGAGAGRPYQPNGQVRPDGGEAMMTAAMSVVARPASDDHALRHAEELARTAKMAETLGHMMVSLDDGELVAADDLRTIHFKIRQMAASRGIDLDPGATDRAMLQAREVNGS